MTDARSRFDTGAWGGGLTADSPDNMGRGRIAKPVAYIIQ